VAERLVVGGSIAALVAADALASAGEPVRLLVGERGLGGGFAPIRRDGRLLELGVRLLELAYEGLETPPPALGDYRPGLGGHRPYAPLIYDWVHGLFGDRLVEVARPEMFFDGRIVDDLYFTTDPLALREALGDAERELIGGEVRAAREQQGADAGLLAPERGPELDVLSVTEASLRNHGQRFHERFIAPMAAKVVSGGGDQMLASMRRKIWVPMFWPSTIASACNGGAVAFRPERPFHTITPHGCGELVDALRERIERAGVRIETAGQLEDVKAASAGRVKLTFSQAGIVEARRPVLGVAPGELFAAAGASYTPEKARSVICWLEARPEDLTRVPSLLNIVDPELAALRVTSGGRGAPGTQLLTVELRHDLPEEQISLMALQALHRTGLLAQDAEAHVVMSAAAPTFALPTRENVDLFAAAHSRLASLKLDAEIVGGAEDFGSDALGEQIVQGLRAAEELLA
jgi:phytoene dehydrogenase-like protein